MKHTSIELETPVEFINVVPVNPLISKCQIKVCWVGETPNRNHSIITKDVARQLANTLPGNPIVGYFDEGAKDFEEHNRLLEISKDGKLHLVDNTRPYGFVDLGAKVWFQKFLDDGTDIREYLMTEGYLWTGQYPEVQRVIDKGNNQSMELDEKTLDATWTKKENGKPRFFIINEAIISKLCILGEDYEPCFEGASITAPKIEFAFDNDFKQQLYSMAKELKDLLSKGGEKMFSRYSVEIGDSLWNSLYDHLVTSYSNENGLIYSIEGIYEDESQKFAVLSNEEGQYFQLKFSVSDSNEVTEVAEEPVLYTTFVPEETPQFSKSAIAEYIEKKNDDKGKNNSNNNPKNKENVEDPKEEKCPKCGKPKSECTCEKDDKKKQYNLEEIPEYIDLKTKFSALEQDYNSLLAAKQGLESEIEPLRQFKVQSERKEKEDMIASFYMLSEDDKKDVIDNIDKYSLDDIEGKLSIICVRNKVKFEDEDPEAQKGSLTYNLNDLGGDLTTPAWVKAAMEVAKNMN